MATNDLPLEGERLPEESFVEYPRNDSRQIEIAENLIRMLFMKKLSFLDRNKAIRHISILTNVDEKILHNSLVVIGNTSNYEG